MVSITKNWSDDDKSFEELKNRLLFKRIVDWTADYLILDDGTKIEIGETEQDCCASAVGEFKNVKLDAMITDVCIEDVKNINSYEDSYETHSECVLKIFHNQNPIALAECEANNGNGDYYYSVVGLRIKGDYFYILGSTDDGSEVKHD